MIERRSTSSTTHQIVVFGLSDRGLQRTNNEDHFMVADLARKVVGVRDNQLLPDLLHHDIGMRGTVLIVADGLGGHEGGEIASQLAVDTVAQALIDTTEQDLPVSEQLIRAIGRAHEAICAYHGAPGYARHMASTLTAVHVGRGMMTIAQVGDSRAYRFNAGKLTLLTEDQTVVYMLQKKGMLTAEEAQHHPHRNIILQALGQDKAVLPEIQTLPLQHNDCLLLCSDGLSSYVAHERIEAIMASGEDEHVRCRRLVEEANAAGGADNVTVLLARLLARDGAYSEATGPPAGRSAQGVERRPHTSRLTTPPQSSWPGQATPQDQAASSPAEQAQRHSWTVQWRMPWLTKDDKLHTAPANAPGKMSFCKRRIRWAWRDKAVRQPGAAPEGSSPIHVQPGETAAAIAWDSEVLKAVEDSLAKHIGPVAQIVVERMTSRAKDLHELCQALAAQLPTEEERQSFLRSVLPQHHPDSGRP